MHNINCDIKLGIKCRSVTKRNTALVVWARFGYHYNNVDAAVCCLCTRIKQRTCGVKYSGWQSSVQVKNCITETRGW